MNFTTNKSQYNISDLVIVTFESPLESAYTLKIQVGDIYRTVSLSAGEESTYFYVSPSYLSSNIMLESASGQMVLTLSSESGVSTQKTILIYCPSTLGPTVSGAAVTPIAGDVPLSWGIYVAGKSRVLVSLDAAAQPYWDSPIASYSISGCGASAQSDSVPISAETGFLAAGENIITVSAVDKRGGVGVQEIVLTAESYQPPALSGIVSLRCQSDGSESDEGVYALVQAEISHSSCNGYNIAECEIAYRRQGETDWIAAGKLQDGSLLFGGDLSTADNWEIRYTVTDLLGEKSVYYDIITRAVWEIHFLKGGGGAAFGGVATEKNLLDVYWNMRVRGVITGSEMFSYDSATTTLTITPFGNTFTYDEATGELYISNPG